MKEIPRYSLKYVSGTRYGEGTGNLRVWLELVQTIQEEAYLCLCGEKG